MPDFDGGARQPRPTRCKPGTEGKICVLSRRRRLKQQLFHHGDAKLDLRDAWAGEQAGGDNVFMVALLYEGDTGVERVEVKTQRKKQHRTEQEKFQAMMNKEREKLRKRLERMAKRTSS